MLPLNFSPARLSLHLDKINGHVQGFRRQKFLFVEVGFALPRIGVLHQLLQSSQLLGLLDALDGFRFRLTWFALDLGSGALRGRAIYLKLEQLVSLIFLRILSLIIDRLARISVTFSPIE